MAANWVRRVFTRLVRPKCPHCGADITPDDLDFRENAMHCRQCGRVSPVAEDAANNPASGDREEWSADSDPPPKPENLESRVEQIGTDLVVRRSQRSMVVGCFLSVWLIGWTAGCVLLLYKVIQEPTLFNILFATPFFAAWVAVSCIVVFSLFGHEQLLAGPKGLIYRSGALARLRSRHVPLEGFKEIAVYATTGSGDSDTTEHGLEIRSTGRTIRFGQGLAEDELVWLADALQRHLHSVAPGWAKARQRKAGEARAQSAAVLQSPVVEVLTPTHPPRQRPADSDIELRRETHDTRINRRSPHWSTFGSFAGLTFLNLFWNGVVSVFVLQLIRDFSWFLFFFLIPFEAIGLAMLLMWLSALTSPFRREKWTFRSGEVSRRSGFLGLGPTRSYKLLHLDRLELRPTSPKPRPAAVRGFGQGGESDRCFSLVLVNADGDDLVGFDSLTEGEARWIADELFHDFQRWFVKVGP